jgi:hypothetical protein
MNFARAVQGTLTRSRAVQNINSQSELELGRQLTKVEEAELYQKLSPVTLMGRIEKVCQAVFLLFVFAIIVYFSMDLGPLNFTYFSVTNPS